MLISLVGGRIVPSFTRNWLTKTRPEVAPPVPAGRFDLAALVATGLALRRREHIGKAVEAKQHQAQSQPAIADKPLHALTVGAVGAMTLAVMTRASLGHTGPPLSARPVTKAIYGLITVAALLRILSPLAGNRIDLALWLAGAAWSCAFGLFAVAYGFVLVRPRVRDGTIRPI